MRNRAGHVGDAVVHHAIDHVAGVGVRSGTRGFDASALVDGDVDDDGALFHRGDHGAGNDLGRGGAGNKDAANDQVRFTGGVGQVVAIGSERIQAAAEQVVQVAKTIQIDVDDCDFGAEAEGDFSGVGADNAAANDGDMRGGNSGNAAEENAAAALF